MPYVMVLQEQAFWYHGSASISSIDMSLFILWCPFFFHIETEYSRKLALRGNHIDAFQYLVYINHINPQYQTLVRVFMSLCFVSWSPINYELISLILQEARHLFEEPEVSDPSTLKVLYSSLTNVAHCMIRSSIEPCS